MAMDMSVDEVKKFWRDYCVRRRIAADVIALGDANIAEDPDYWADQEMQELLNLVTGKGPAGNAS
jgi:hypothetical protein